MPDPPLGSLDHPCTGGGGRRCQPPPSHSLRVGSAQSLAGGASFVEMQQAGRWRFPPCPASMSAANSG